MQFSGIHKKVRYDLTHRKAIPYFKKGKTLWFDRNEIEAWIKSGRPAILQGAMKIIRDKNKGAF